MALSLSLMSGKQQIAGLKYVCFLQSDNTQYIPPNPSLALLWDAGLRKKTKAACWEAVRQKFGNEGGKNLHC